MKLKILIGLLVLFLNSNVTAQDLNAYKYVVIPKQFGFQKSEDQYQVNSLAKFLFNKKGFTALIDSETLPNDLANNPCMGLKVKVLENSNIFTTKLTIELSDCRNAVVMTTEEGKSKIKDFKKGHHDALRKAFQSIQAVDYNYDASWASNLKKEELKVSKQVETKETPVVITKKTVDREQAKEGSLELLNESPKVEIKKNDEKPIEFANDKVLYAQVIENGFQLVDNTPKKVFVALKSATDGLYYLKEKAGILYMEGDQWFAEYYKDNQLIKEELTIKF